jgi:putative FmdB family regulatory protein
MPIYVYECQECSVVKEELQKSTEEPLTDCEGCNGENSLKRIIGLSSFQLKGGGWYEDGYSKGGG